MAAKSEKKAVRPTMKAIAKRAGVSRATVSLILTNRPEVLTRFKAETVERVRQVAEQLGYRANLMASSLRAPHPFFFALVLRGTNTADVISWHHQAFEGQFLAGVLEEARRRKLYPVLATQAAPEADSSLYSVERILEGGVFGAILRTPLEVLNTTLQRHIESGGAGPIVIVFPEHPQSTLSNCIDMDNVAAGRIAGQLLHQAGRRRWAIVREEPVWEALRMREAGFMAAAQEFGASIDVLDVPPGISEKATMEWLAPKLRSLKPDGVYAASSIAGVGALLACQVAGLKVPEKTCLVGCDASLWRAPGCPPITSVDVSWYLAGRLAVRKMVEMGEKSEATFENILLAPYVRKGGTCPGGAEEPGEIIPELAELPPAG